jgi:hypothetical protein
MFEYLPKDMLDGGKCLEGLGESSLPDILDTYKIRADNIYTHAHGNLFACEHYFDCLHAIMQKVDIGVCAHAE